MVRVFYSESDWLHCPKCGADTVEFTRPAGFDAMTGVPKVDHYRKCPRARWWNSAAPAIWDTGRLHLGATKITYIGPRPKPVPPAPTA